MTGNTSIPEWLKSVVKMTQHCVEINKPRVLAALANEEIPLDERWEFYCSLPEYLLDHRGGIWEPDVVDLSRILVWAERGQVFTMADCVSDLEYNLWYPIEESEEEPYFNAERILTLKQEILRTGLGSFTFDW